MTEIKWSLRGREFVQCNCDFGCPCQFGARPTHGGCDAVLGVDIIEGSHGETRLDGLKVAAIVTWPGAIHEGRGHIVPIVDERATPEQRQALLRIMSGEDTEPGATMFQVFSTTYEKVYDPVFATIELDVDVDRRRATFRVPGQIESRGEPIVNPVSGEEHRMRVEAPDGFEYATAEVGRGWTSTSGPISHDLKNSHAHFADLHLSQSGVVR